MTLPLSVIAPGKKLHRTVSPSQVDNYRKCPRRWYNASVLYDRQPQPAFMMKGEAVHKALEVYGQTGEVLTSVSMPNPEKGGALEEISTFAFVQAAIPHIKPPANDPYWNEWKGKGPNGSNSAGLMLEQQADMATWADYGDGADGSDYRGPPNIGPNWTQYIDRIEAFPDTAKITDYKTTSDFRYAKKPAEFLENTQLMANARWLFQNSDYKEIEIGHLSLGTKTKTPKALPVYVTVTREDVEKQWAKDLEIVKEMVTWVAMGPPTADPLPPNTSSCGEYGGCYYRDKCGFDKQGLTQIRSFGSSSAAPSGAPQVSKPLFPITLTAPKAPVTLAPQVPITLGTPLQGVRPMETATTPASAPKGGLLATLIAGRKANGVSGADVGTTPSQPASTAAPSASPAPVVGLIVPATGTAPAVAPAAPKGLAALLGKKAPATAPVAPSAPAVLEAAPGSISPPDASSDVSTPEEVAAANPEPKAETVASAPEATPSTEGAPVSEAPAKRKGRPPGSKNKPAEGSAEAVGPAPAPATPPGSSVSSADLVSAASAAIPGLTMTASGFVKSDELVTLGAPPAGEDPILVPQDVHPASPPPVDEQLEAIRAKLRNGDAAFPCPVKFLFVDCMPGKGWGETPADLNDFMHAFESTAASSAQALDYRLIRFESKGYLSMAIRVLMKGLPAAIHVNTNTPGAAEFLAEVTPYAEMVFRGTR